MDQQELTSELTALRRAIRARRRTKPDRLSKEAVAIVEMGVGKFDVRVLDMEGSIPESIYYGDARVLAMIPLRCGWAPTLISAYAEELLKLAHSIRTVPHHDHAMERMSIEMDICQDVRETFGVAL